jgi:hypothetical protein
MKGPKAKIRNKNPVWIKGFNTLSTCILSTEIPKPNEFTMVRAVPLPEAGAFWATKVENIGESAVTAKPQNIKKRRKSISEFWKNIKGEMRQHMPDKLKAVFAIDFGKNFSDKNPPMAQDNPPIPMITNDMKGISNS